MNILQSGLAFVQRLLPYQLKEEQLRLISAAAQGHHTLGILPTGFGKSVCFALVGPLLDHVC